MKWLRKIYYRLFPTYRRLALVSVPYSLADRMIRENEGKPENEQWVIAHEEDVNITQSLSFIVEPHVYLERKERIL